MTINWQSLLVVRFPQSSPSSPPWYSASPPLQVTSPHLVSSLQEGQRTIVGSRRVSRLRNLLLLGQVAVPVVLLVFGGSFLRVLTRLTSIDLGFASDHIALLSVDLSMQGYTPERGRAFVDEALTRLRDVPGVTAVDMAARVMLPEVHRFARPQ